MSKPASHANIVRPLKQHSKSDLNRSRIIWLIIANVIGVGGAIGLFYGIMYADFLSSGFRSTLTFFENHQVLMALAAAMPFFATILIGYGYAKRGIGKKRAREAAEAAERQRSEAEARVARGPLT